MHHGQPTPQDELNDYPVRVIVAGSRKYNDYRFFSEVLSDYVEQYDDPVIFISGKAKTGADALIIRWCQEFHLPWAEFPANWDLGKHAGYVRNAEMAAVATNLIAFWDGQSRGTKHMLGLAKKHNLIVLPILIDIEPKEEPHGW